MVDRPIFDHVAIAVHRWSDGFDLLVHELGGVWGRGGDAGEFAPGQLSYEHDMKVELLEPGRSGVKGFVDRFLERQGPGAHHLTFKVPDIERFNRGCESHGFEVMPGSLELADRQETFVHPRQTGWGTLLQAIQDDGTYDAVTPRPEGFPEATAPQHALVWVAVVIPDVSDALSLLTRVLDGTVIALDLGPAGGWALVEWSPARRLLLTTTGALASMRGHAGAVGVDHVLFGRPGTPPPDPAGWLARPLPPVLPLLGVPIAQMDAGGEPDRVLR
ncbi:MAG: VOC family protein [Acidimicrobiia bacterium]|nr:VOC family protein [Acidimicrobiia bacterium]